MAIAAGTTLRMTTANRPIPNVVVTAALAAACAVSVPSSGTGDGGAPPVVKAVAANRGSYLGYAYAAAGIGEQAPLANGAIVEGFTGVVQGSKVYIADDGALTHTKPATGAENVNQEFGTVNATKVFNIIVPQGATKVNSIRVGVKTAVAAHEDNHWTFSCLNKGAAGDGTTAILAATAANTTDATGGSGLTAYVARSLALTATAADLVVSEGQILEMTLTKAASAADLVQLTVEVEFATAEDDNVEAIGLGVSTTKIYFFAR